MDQNEKDTYKFFRNGSGFFNCKQCTKKFFTKTVFADDIIKENGCIETEQFYDSNEVQRKVKLRNETISSHCQFSQRSLKFKSNQSRHLANMQGVGAVGAEIINYLK